MSCMRNIMAQALGQSAKPQNSILASALLSFAQCIFVLFWNNFFHCVTNVEVEYLLCNALAALLDGSAKKCKRCKPGGCIRVQRSAVKQKATSTVSLWHWHCIVTSYTSETLSWARVWWKTIIMKSSLAYIICFERQVLLMPLPLLPLEMCLCPEVMKCSSLFFWSDLSCNPSVHLCHSVEVY